MLAQIHKKQTDVMPPPRPEQARRANPPVVKRDPVATVALKWFVGVMSIGLMATTVLGIYMAFKFNPGRRLIWALLVLGTVLPLAIVLL